MLTHTHSNGDFQPDDALNTIYEVLSGFVNGAPQMIQQSKDSCVVCMNNVVTDISSQISNLQA